MYMCICMYVYVCMYKDDGYARWKTLAECDGSIWADVLDARRCKRQD